MRRSRTGSALHALLFLHLALSAGDLECATHAHDHAADPPAGQPPRASHAHHGTDQPDPASTPASDEDCSAPSRADCCGALASCGIAVALAEVTSEAPPLTQLHLGPRTSETARSRTHPPDTPPPKQV